MEEDLIRSAQLGNETAFGKLVEIYAQLTERTARALVIDRTVAEDAVQEAWIDVWLNLSHFQLDRPFRPWLLTIVANRCRKSLRRNVLPVVQFDNCLSEILTSTADPETSVLNTIYQDELRVAITKLQFEQQQILALRFFSDLKLEEIATVIDMPLGTVKSRLHRSLNTLRIKLQETEIAIHSKNGRKE